MSTEIEPVAEELYDKLRSRFDVRLHDKDNKPMDGKQKVEPRDAKYFNFVYKDSSGHKFGSVTISLANETELVLMMPKDITRHMDQAQRKEWTEFLISMSKFARRRPNLKYTVSNLDRPGHVKNHGSDDNLSNANDVSMNESRMQGIPGRPRHSMGEHMGIKIRVIHTDPPLDEVRGSRTRHIESIYLETPEGERFKVPNNLPAAKAHATHLANYGNPYDEIGECINNMVEEMNAMRRFVRAAKRNPFEDVEAGQMANHAINRYYHIQDTLKHLANKRHYDEFVENFVPEEAIEDDLDLEALRERFSRRVYDERLDSALPLVYKEHLRQKSRKSNILADEFGTWAEGIMFEDDGENDAVNDQLQALQKYCEHARTVGVNSVDAKTDLEYMLQGLPGIDWLMQDLTEKSDNTRGQGSDYDARQSVKSWAQQFMPEWADQLMFGDKNVDDAHTNWQPQTSPQSAHPNDTYGATGLDDPVTDPNIPTAVQEDNLDFIRFLAGLKQNK